MLTRSEIAAFVRDGYVTVPAATSRRVAASCRRAIDARLARQGIDTRDPTTWRQPVVHVPWPDTAAFRAAAAAPPLTEAYDQLLGPGAWAQYPTIGGTVPVRFPTRRRARDTVWHVDGTFARDGAPVTTLASPFRGVLCLILLSDIGPTDAPTELKVGSHLDIPPILEPYGDDGCPFLDITAALPAATLERPSVFVTGQAGDAYVCHPFLLHRAAAANRGERPRVLAQPGMMRHRPFRAEGGRPRPVERAVRQALDGVRSAPPARSPRRPAPGGRAPATRDRTRSRR